ncbi:flagellar biosynthesis protein FlhA, partial [Candidatus Poribacteria bacterium]|nr:flagellar biosynthesis protein FlhA [Candidatus Poribacteria bacterium]
MARIVSSLAPQSWSRRNAGMAVGIAVLGIIMMLFVPLPPWMLDTLIACNLALAIFTLMVSLFIRRPLDFSVFPTLLLIMTLYRLALN